MSVVRELHEWPLILAKSIKSVVFRQDSIIIGIFLSFIDLFIENNGSFFQKDAGTLLGTDGIYFGTDGIFWGTDGIF